MGKKADRTRQCILNVAVKEFAAKGFDGVRVDAIAKKAKVNKERIYCYFKSKEKLHVAVLEHTYGHIVEAERALLSLTEKDTAFLTERILKLYFDFHRTHPEFSRILAWENLCGGRRFRNFGGARSETFRHLSSIYRLGQSSGIFSKNVSFESYLFTLSAVSFFYFSNMATMSDTLSLDLSLNETAKRLMKECVILIND